MTRGWMGSASRTALWLGVLSIACRFDSAGNSGDGGETSGGSSSATSGPTTSASSSAQTGDPTGSPTGSPTGGPTGDPTGDPTGGPTGDTTGDPTSDPTSSNDVTTIDPDTGDTGSTTASGDGVYPPCGEAGCPSNDICIFAPSMRRPDGDACAPQCDVVDTCPPSPGGTAEVVCVFGVCALDCTDGDCPDGMECMGSAAGTHCFWPQQK